MFYYTKRMVLLKYLKIWRDTDLKIILLNQNNYLKRLKCWWQCRKKFQHSSNQFEHPHNYLIVQTKLFSNLYLSEFSDASAKPFFLCNYMKHSE